MKKGTLHLNMTGEAAELYFMARAAALGLIVSKKDLLFGLFITQLLDKLAPLVVRRSWS